MKASVIMIFLCMLWLNTIACAEQGLKPIQDIQVGDKVLALDERTQQTSYQPVLQLIQNKGQYQFIKVTLENGEQLEATAEHPFYIQGKGWNAAANLKVGDALLLHNGTTLVIKTLDTSVRVDAVYNFTVANLHNYFVGKDGVGVHNAKGDRCGGLVEGKQDIPKDATLLRSEVRRVNSQEFFDFLAKNGLSRKGWNYVMKTWRTRDGRIIEQHYWRHDSGLTYYHL